ncbi:Rieske (2Fe-2S) protein [Streptomyces piniterrae]|uniref:Cytochrome bc1 complex Rieske iron-sulfur subunit n=1 Tax=Streptomyces piniterrae TaxID=2571125 RepID=A0A4U0NVQ0_9ACTN|nr:Rieske (2Fe-2S) protein [Streptomyces piniterrae]TJZ58650.1 Rieske (2Fe-2S) protein [Streptomyces piniterrae]
MARQTPAERTGESDAAAGAVDGPARRTVVAAVGAAGLTAALSACGGSAQAGGVSLAKTSEIPKGGGKIFKDEKVVVTQPQDGEFKAFSAVCPHVGCVVGEVSGGTINCMCHGSKFDITDGSVKDGPATKGLATAKVSVEGGSVTLD